MITQRTSKLLCGYSFVKILIQRFTTSWLLLTPANNTLLFRTAQAIPTSFNSKN